MDLKFLTEGRELVLIYRTVLDLVALVTQHEHIEIKISARTDTSCL